MANEDLTTYTEHDPSSRLTVTSSRSTFAGLEKEDIAYVYDDKDAGHFSGDFEHLLTGLCSAKASGSQAFIWALTNLVDTFKGIDDASGGELAVSFWEYFTFVYVRLDELFAGSIAYDSYKAALSTIYHLKVKRTEGSPSVLYCYIYDDDAGSPGDLLDTLSLNLNEDENFRYIYATQSYEVSGGATSGYSENFDLQEVVAGNPWWFYSMQRRQ